MAAVVAGVNGIPGSGEDLPEPGIARGMLGHPVRDLDDRFGGEPDRLDALVASWRGRA